MLDCRIDFLNWLLDAFEVMSASAFHLFFAEILNHGPDVGQKMGQITIVSDKQQFLFQGVMYRFVVSGSFYFHASL